MLDNILRICEHNARKKYMHEIKFVVGETQISKKTMRMTMEFRDWLLFIIHLWIQKYTYRNPKFGLT